MSEQPERVERDSIDEAAREAVEAFVRATVARTGVEPERLGRALVQAGLRLTPFEPPRVERVTAVAANRRAPPEPAEALSAYTFGALLFLPPAAILGPPASAQKAK